MLTEIEVRQADNIADILRTNGVHLTASSGTPLSNLVNSLASLDEAVSNEDIIDQSNTGLSVMGSHDELEVGYAKSIAIIMGNVVSTARNTVTPICKTIIEQINSHRQVNKLEKVGLLGNIEYVDMPELFMDDMFMQLISSFKSVTQPSSNGLWEQLVKLRELALVNGDEMELILTGSQLLDERIKSYMGENVFNVFDGIEDLVNFRNLKLQDKVKWFLYLSGIQQCKNSVAENLMSDDLFVSAINNVIAFLGGEIYRDSALFDQIIKEGSIIAHGNIGGTYNEDNTLFVFGVNYRNWVSNLGGSPEAALGYYASTNGIYDAVKEVELRNNPAKFKEIYDQRISHIKDISNLEDAKLVRRVTLSYLSDYISSMQVDNTEDKVKFQANLSEAMKHEYYGETLLYAYVVKAVTRTLVEGDSVKILLLELDSILKTMESPNMDKAVEYASRKLIARWLVSQIQKNSI